jgi:hypothetical protein
MMFIPSNQENPLFQAMRSQILHHQRFLDGFLTFSKHPSRDDAILYCAQSEGGDVVMHGEIHISALDVNLEKRLEKLYLKFVQAGKDALVNDGKINLS